MKSFSLYYLELDHYSAVCKADRQVAINIAGFVTTIDCFLQHAQLSSILRKEKSMWYVVGVFIFPLYENKRSGHMSLDYKEA